MYIDESGNPDLASADNPNERFLGLTGVIIDVDYHDRHIRSEMDAFKSKFWPEHCVENPVVLHRKDILYRRGPFEILKIQRTADEFDSNMLDLLSAWPYLIVTAVIDKLAHVRKYRAWQEHPYYYCLKILLERYVIYLSQKNAQGDAMAEARGAKQDKELESIYTTYFETGAGYRTPDEMQRRLTSRQLKVKRKEANIAGLQIADLLAYPSRLDTLVHNGLATAAPHPFQDRVGEIVLAKYYRNGRTQEIDGCGRKLLP